MVFGREVLISPRSAAFLCLNTIPAMTEKLKPAERPAQLAL